MFGLPPLPPYPCVYIQCPRQETVAMETEGHKYEYEQADGGPWNKGVYICGSTYQYRAANTAGLLEVPWVATNLEVEAAGSSSVLVVFYLLWESCGLVARLTCPLGWAILAWTYVNIYFIFTTFKFFTAKGLPQKFYHKTLPHHDISSGGGGGLNIELEEDVKYSP